MARSARSGEQGTKRKRLEEASADDKQPEAKEEAVETHEVGPPEALCLKQILSAR